MDTHKKGGIPARLQILVKIKFDQKKRVGKRDNDSLLCFGREKLIKGIEPSSLLPLIGYPDFLHSFSIYSLAPFITRGKVRGQGMGESYDFHVTMISGHI